MKPTVCSSSPVSSSVLSLISFFDKSKSAGLLKTERKKVVRRDQAHTKDERRDKRQNNSEKNNSIDEFLKLVNKTKKKYKELMEADIDKERNVQTDQTNPLKITGGDDALREIEKESLMKCLWKTEARMMVLNSKCEQLNMEKKMAIKERKKVSLMSDDQIDKLQDLERTQDLMEVQNLKLKEDLLSFKRRNTELINNVEDLRNQVNLLKKEKENLSREIERKMSTIESTKYESKEYLSPTFIMEELEKTIEFLEKTIGEHKNEIIILKENSKKELKLLEEIHEKERGNLISQISSLEAEILSMRKEKNNADISIELLKEEIKKELENLKCLKKKELKREIHEIKFLLKSSRENDQSSSSLNSPYVLKLKQQLKEALDDLRTSKRQRRILSEEKHEMEEMIETSTKSRDDLGERYMELLRENYKASSALKESEEEFKMILSKYEKAVSAMSSQQYLLENQSQTIANLENEKAELEGRVERSAGTSDVNTELSDTEKYLRVTMLSLEAKFTFEAENCKRLISVNNKLKQRLERSESECTALLSKSEKAEQSHKSLQSKLRTLRAECLTWKNKELKTQELRSRAEQSLKISEAEVLSLKQNLETANRRIKSLQLDLFLNSEFDSDLFSEDDSDDH